MYICTTVQLYNCTTKSIFNRKVDITNSIRNFFLILMIYMNCYIDFLLRSISHYVSKMYRNGILTPHILLFGTGLIHAFATWNPFIHWLGGWMDRTGGPWKHITNQLRNWLGNNFVVLIFLYFFPEKFDKQLASRLFELKTSLWRSQLPTICGWGGLTHDFWRPN